MDLGLKDKRILITGGTRGIGAAIVETLLQEGAKVAFCARNQEQVSVCETKWQGQGYEVFGSVCDVADKPAYLSWIQKAAEEMGGVDIFIPNVSGGASGGDEGWQSAFNVDMMATVNGCEAVLPYLAANKGSIVVIASIGGLEAMGEPSGYNAMKAGLIAYASQLGDAVAAHGIRVNCVSPGPIHVDDGFWGAIEKSQPDMYQAVCNRHAEGRLGTTKEVATAVTFLASPSASWITRTNLIIDGGFTKRIQF